MGYVDELRRVIGTRPVILVGAAVIIRDRAGAILLQRRTDNNLWSLPGGALESGETLAEAARREVLEETGLSVGTLRLVDVFSGPDLFYELPNGDQVHNVNVIFEASEVEGDLHPNPAEVQELRFFDPTSLPEKISPPDRPVLRRYALNR